jgi:hypothetical protein
MSSNGHGSTLRKTAIRLLKESAGVLGIEISRRRAAPASTSWPYSFPAEELAAAIRTVKPNTMLSDARLRALYDYVVHCERHGVAGCFVQCGTWEGGGAGLLALANLARGTTRRHLHLFDSFEGIPEPDASIDGARAIQEAERAGIGTSGRLVANPEAYTRMGRGYGALPVCRAVLEERIGYPADHLHYHKGYFQDTVPRAAGQLPPIAILHLDGDWYDSTRVCIEHLYDRVVPGGFIVVDDYGAYDGCRRAVDEFLTARDIRGYLHKIDHEAVTLLKP